MADNSTDDNSNPVDMDDLSSFQKSFYGKDEAPKPVPAEEDPDDEIDENEADPLANDEDADADEGDETPAEDEVDEDEEPVEEPKPKPKSRAQKRIEDLVADVRVTERERDAERIRVAELTRRLEELEGRKVEQKEPTLQELLPAGAPTPDKLDDKGEPLYPLGEFDPKYIRDLTVFTIKQEREDVRKEEAKANEAKEIKAAQEALTAEWATKLSEAEKEIPEIRDNIKNLVETFAGVETSYGEYLAMTIMSCENGPEIMNYLSQNIGEAQKIVASGLSAATLSIGRLDDRFDRLAISEEKQRNKRVSDAPNLPTNRSRGRGVRTVVRGDTDDLEAFQREFYSRD